MSTNTVITVPSWAQDYVKQYGQRAYDLWNLPAFVAYTGQIVASQAQNEADGIAALATRGETGDLVISKATAFILDVIQGNRLAGTKQEFIDALALVTGNSTTDFASVNSRIGKKARYVGDPDSTFLAQALATGYPATFNARISAAIHADNYSKERVFRDHALAYGVEMGKHPVIDAETLRKAGLANRDYLQNSYVLNHKYFIEGQEMAVANLEIFGNMLRALTGSQQTTTSTDPKGNKLMGAVGGAIAGAAIGSIIPGVGTLIGAFVGGVIGFLGS